MPRILNPIRNPENPKTENDRATISLFLNGQTSTSTYFNFGKVLESFYRNPVALRQGFSISWFQTLFPLEARESIPSVTRALFDQKKGRALLRPGIYALPLPKEDKSIIPRKSKKAED